MKWMTRIILVLAVTFLPNVARGHIANSPPRVLLTKYVFTCGEKRSVIEIQRRNLAPRGLSGVMPFEKITAIVDGKSVATGNLVKKVNEFLDVAELFGDFGHVSIKCGNDGFPLIVLLANGSLASKYTWYLTFRIDGKDEVSFVGLEKPFVNVARNKQATSLSELVFLVDNLKRNSEEAR